MKNFRLYKSTLISFFVSLSLGSQAFTNELGLQETLKDRAVRWVANLNDAPIEDVSIAWSDQRLRFPRCMDPWKFSHKENIPNIIAISCENEEWSISLRYSLNIPVPLRSRGDSDQLHESIENHYLTFKRAMNRGDVISATDINWYSESEQYHGHEHSSYIGQFLNVPVREGTRLFRSMLSEGQEVLVAISDISEGQKLTARDFVKKRTLAQRRGDLLPLDFEFIPDLRALVFISQGETVKSSMVGSPVEALIATRLIMPGELISEMNSEIKITYNDIPHGAITDLNQLRRSVAATQIQPGKVIRFIDSRQQHDVMKGDEVKLTVAGHSFRLELSMIAAESGFLGDSVKLTNPESGRTVIGTVTGNKRASK